MFDKYFIWYLFNWFIFTWVMVIFGNFVFWKYFHCLEYRRLIFDSPLNWHAIRQGIHVTSMHLVLELEWKIHIEAILWISKGWINSWLIDQQELYINVYKKRIRFWRYVKESLRIVKHNVLSNFGRWTVLSFEELLPLSVSNNPFDQS